jgi:DNA-binding SARP family transcriptional activator
LLGRPELTLGGEAIVFRRRKTLALLVYLVLARRPTARETLATMFADDASEGLALQSLRASVAELRALVGAHVILSRQVIAFDNGSRHWCDVHEFQRHIAEAAPDDLHALLAATNLYGGQLLAGFALRSASGFEAWLASERQQLRDLALQAWHTLLDAHSEAEELEAGLVVAERMIAVNPTAELTYRKAMGLAVTHGERERAMDFYERCRATLAEQLGVTPLPETTALYERIRAGAAAYPRATPATNSGGTLSAELSLLFERLAAPECRLVTILAPLPALASALALLTVTHYLAPGQASQEHPFPDGVYMTAPAAHLQQNDALSYALERTLRQNLSKAVPRTNGEHTALLTFLSGRAMLLVLDGLTPTNEEASFVASILREAPRVKLLVAARERLRLEEEWVLDIPRPAAAPHSHPAQA